MITPARASRWLPISSNQARTTLRRPTRALQHESPSLRVAAIHDPAVRSNPLPRCGASGRARRPPSCWPLWRWTSTRRFPRGASPAAAASCSSWRWPSRSGRMILLDDLLAGLTPTEDTRATAILAHPRRALARRRHQRPRAPSPRPRSQVITPPAPHAAPPLELRHSAPLRRPAVVR